MTSTMGAAVTANGEQATRIGLTATVSRVLLSLICPAFAALALVMMAPVGAEAGQPVNQTYTCPGGSFLTGLQGRAGDWLDQFQPVCRTWSPEAGNGANETHGDNFGNVNGGNRPVRSVCVVGSAIYGITYDIAYPNGPPGHVYNVNVGCVALPYFDANVRISLDGQASIWSSVFNFCDNGTIAKGVTIGLDGINITNLVPVCDTVENIVATAPPPPPPTPTGQTLSPGSAPNASEILKALTPSFSITKVPQGPCEHGLYNGFYQCYFDITITNTGLAPYNGPLIFTDVSGYQDGVVGIGGIQPFDCPGSPTCSAHVSLQPGGSVTAQAELNVPKEDAAKSACINVANSVALTTPVTVGPVWTHSTLPAESGCLPNGTVTNGPVPPLCPAGWTEVVDPSLLPADYARQTVTLNGMSILCARRRLSASDVIKLIQPPCPPHSHLLDGQCVPDLVLVPINPTPQSGLQCRVGTVNIGRSCVPACPDGSVMPANRDCGPKIILRTPDQRLACLNGQPRDIHGNCPQTAPAACPFGESGTPPNCHRILRLPKDTSQTPNTHPGDPICPDGKTLVPKGGIGQCPAAPRLLHLHNIFNTPAVVPPR